MTVKRREDPPIWIISRGRHVAPDFPGLPEGIGPGMAREYSISDLGRYMLAPSPIEVEKKLVGCRILLRRPMTGRLMEGIRRALPKGLKRLIRQGDVPFEEVMADPDMDVPRLKEAGLEAHFRDICDRLKQNDPVVERLSGLNSGTVKDIIGICEDLDGNRSLLNLQGGIEEKTAYMKDFISRPVGVVLDRPFVSDGLFEMRGFDFGSYDSRNSYKLLKLRQQGRTRCCVLGRGDRIEYWVEDPRLVDYMHLLEQSVRTDSQFMDTLNLCVEGNARPVRLFFHDHLKIEYSETHLPKAYQEVFETYPLGSRERAAVMDSISRSQMGISLNFVPRAGAGENRLVTSISVMHDLRALEPIREDLPQLYSEMNRRASVSEAGRFYLLDSIRGYKDE
jgi:hypothetical protein